MDLTPEQQDRYEYAMKVLNYKNQPVDVDLNKFIEESTIKIQELQDDLQSLMDRLDDEYAVDREA
jgi:hypothetical protein